MKTITITKDEYKNAVGEAIVDMTTRGDSPKDAKLTLVEIAVSTKLAKVLEDKLFGGDDDE